MSVRIRPFEERDWPRYVEIANLTYPEYQIREDEARHRYAAWDESRFWRLRLVAEDREGIVCGMADTSQSPGQFHPHRYWVEIMVDPQRRRHGVGNALFTAVLDTLRTRRAELIRAEASETRRDAIEFMRQHGFVEIGREWESRLDVPAFDRERFSGVEERLARQGITITTFAEERAKDPDLLRKLYEVNEASRQDAPRHDPTTPVPFEMFAAWFDAPAFLPDAFFIAKDATPIVGGSSAYRSLDDPDLFYQRFTGVRPEYRRRGIAVALKLRVIRYVREHGGREIRTWNDTRNEPMLRLNESLGYAKQPAWITFEKKL